MTPTSTRPRIEARALVKRFGQIHAVRGIDLAVPSGQVLGFLGPNGAGKSTTMRMITGFLEPTSGSVTLDGIAPGLYTLRADQIGADGQVASRFETPFQRETEAALAAAAAVAEEAEAGADAAAPSAEATAPADGAPADAAAATTSGPVSVTVQPGFTLWRIARENLGDGVLYVQVFEANKDQIRDPDLIYPGQVFAIPKAD